MIRRKPLKHALLTGLSLLAAAATAIGDGDLSVRVPTGPEIAANDEMKALLEKFNLMASRLETTVRALRRERDDEVVTRLGEHRGGMRFRGARIEEFRDAREPAVVATGDDAMGVGRLRHAAFGDVEAHERHAQVGGGTLRLEACLRGGPVRPGRAGRPPSPRAPARRR